MLICVYILTVAFACMVSGEDDEFDQVDGRTYANYKTGRFQIYNKSDVDLFVTKVSHLVSNDPQNGHGSFVYNVNVTSNNLTPVYEFDYQNGWLAGFDYWFISVRNDGDEWHTKSNFFCNIGKEDIGVVVLIIDIDKKQLEVVPPVSSACVTRLL